MLKIFFGYAAGVGKTYAMLEAAHKAAAEGVDVVVGYIEPHTRPETTALLDGLEVLSPMRAGHGSITVNEFDLDAVIARKPRLVLVDELAHTNAPGCRNHKRYQDIDELLRAGIDVYTTVNVQHIESLHDMVCQITGIIVSERLPDRVIDDADRIELVDIEPSELLERLRAGKVYREAQAARAMDNFFTVENLIALREIALRRTADQINHRNDIARAASHRDYYTNEHILICLSPSPSNAKVIRAAARMSEVLHGAFTALYVERSGTTDLEGANLERLRSNLKLAEQLGARIATVYGDNIPEQIAQYAHAAEVSRIIIGRSNNRRGLFAKPSFVEQLTCIAPNLDIYIIPDNQPRYSPPRRRLRVSVPQLTAGDTLRTSIILVISTLLGLGLWGLDLGEANIICCYILGVLLTSVFTHGRVYSITSSILSVVLFNFFFTNPRFSFQAYGVEYPVTFVVMFAVAVLTSTLTTQIKEQSRQNALKASRTEVLLETSQKLQKAEGREELYTVMGNQLLRLVSRTVIIYPLAEDGSPVKNPRVFGCEVSEADRYLTAQERAVAEWVLANNKNAGAGTKTLSGASCLYLAVRGSSSVRAVTAIAAGDDESDTYEKNLLIAMLGEFGLSLDKEIIREEQQRSQLRVNQEELRSSLLRAISHDLRTPLTSISGNASMLLQNRKLLDEEQIIRLENDIYDDSMWLISLVENLLSLTRFDNAGMQLTTQPELLDEVIREALRHISRRSAQYRIKASLADDLLMAQMDAPLIMQVIINLVDNAIKYTPAGSTIVVTAYQVENHVVVEVADNGSGIADDDKQRIFDMFYTAGKPSEDSRRGLGLGLSLCRSVVAAHGGGITVRDNQPRGTVFSFTIPMQGGIPDGTA